jgi:antitoxin PrlF
MALAHSRLTAQGQISVPAEIRKKLGVGPGSVLEWDEENGQIIVRRAGRYSSVDIHQALFQKKGVEPKIVEEMTAGIARHIKGRHARR